MILVSVDDVRLYNQLYGNKEGDIVLINVARIMDDYVNTQGYTARLGKGIWDYFTKLWTFRSKRSGRKHSRANNEYE